MADLDKIVKTDHTEQDYESGLRTALSLCRDLYLEEAEELLMKISTYSRCSSDAYSALALVKLLQGEQWEQHYWLKKSIQLQPTHYKTLHQLAISMLLSGEPQKALIFAKKALEERPDAISSALLASQAYLRIEEYNNAVDQADHAISLSGGWNHHQAIQIKSQALYAISTETTKLDIFDELASGSEDLASLAVLCQLIFSEGCQEEYVKKAGKAIATNPESKLLYLLRVCMLRMLGRPDDCFPDLYYLLSIDSSNPAVLIHFAEIFLTLHRYKESLEAYLQIRRLSKPDADLYSQIGVCYRGLGLLLSAYKATRRAVHCNPLSWAAVGNFGELCFRLGDHHRARKLYGISLNLNPLSDTSFFNLMLAYSIGEATGMHEMLELARNYWDKRKEETSVQCEEEESILSSLDQSKHSRRATKPGSRLDKKIKVCILTSDIGNHCVSYFLSSFLRHYPKDLFRVELALCSRRYEERELLICGYADLALSLEGQSEDEARRLIKSSYYDIIIECNGYTGDSGLAILSHRCAPIQCHYIGYHASTGLDTIDYFISDSYIFNDKVSLQVSEKPALLDRAWLAFSTFDQPPKAEAISSVEKPILGFFGNSTKITDTTLEYWQAILMEAGEAILLLKDLSFNDHRITQKTLQRLNAKGIDSSRVALLAPTSTWLEHMACYNLIDYALDSTPWSSATTGFDAIAMGVPLLAIEGDTIASRMSSSLIHHLGYPHLISRSKNEYAKLGRWIQDDFMNTRMNKYSLQKHALSSSLFDGADLTNSLTVLLLKLYQSHNAGDPVFRSVDCL